MLEPSTPRPSASIGSDLSHTFTSTTSASLRTRDTPTAGEVTPQTLSRIEARLLPEVDAAERRGPAVHHPAGAEVSGGDARELWALLSIVQK